MEQFTLEDLAMAYRKAKVDVYYSTNPRRLDLLEYESNLERNLTALMDRVNGDDDAWVTSIEFLGSAYVMPKGAKLDGEGTSAGPKSRWSDPRENWTAAKRGATRAEYSFRVMALCSIDFHVLSSLWVSAVGAHLEAELSDASRGNRLRRKAVGTSKVSPSTGTLSGILPPRKSVGEFNDLAHGSFGPYMHPYRKWRDEGMSTARDALNGKRDVVVISADLASYYHSLDASFLDRDSFLALFNFELTDRGRRLNRLFVAALNAWPQAAQRALGFEVRGLPVGLPISGVVANLALIEFDRLVEGEVRPLYYGRYVDDLLIVLPDVGHDDGADMWAWLATRLDGMVTVDGERQLIHRGYLDGSVIEINSAKSMTLHLSGKSGLALVGSIERTIHARASEWRSLPSLSDDPQEIVTDIAQVFQADGDLADSFRTVDLMSARRSAFAMRLRDYEAYEADLDPASWAAQRSAFYEAVNDYALSVPGYFELAAYITRVVKIAAASGDFDAIERMILNLSKIREVIELESKVSVKGARRSELLASRVAKNWAIGAARQIAEVITCAVASEPKTGAVKQVNDALARLTGSTAVRLRAGALLGLASALADADLGHVPFRFRFITLGQSALRSPAGEAEGAESFARLLPTHVASPLRNLGRLLPRTSRERRKVDLSIPNGIAYPTRPFGLVELFIMASPDPDNGAKFDRAMGRVRDAVLAQRGYDASEMLPSLSPDRSKDLIVPRDKASGTRRVAVAMVATTGASWAAAANGNPDLTPSRHRALSDAINEVLRAPRGVDYFTLPELSVPWTWFVRFAQKLRSQDIGLIAGVEYLHGPNKTVHNQVWASLPLDGSDFPGTYLHRQDKMTPAIHEAADLTVVAGRRLKAERPWSSVPVIRHGEFAFGMLVCSELTNIEYRSQLRGRVDAVFLPAWNQDLNTFNALVEAAALDIHAYVILTNDRAYGDSRIRAPMKQDWERDILRLRGGVENYVAIAEVDIQALRAHHNTKRPNGPRFKPLPDGFKVSQGRRGPSLGPGGH